MNKRIKTNIILLIISVLSVLGESMYWALRSAEDHFPNETAFEEFVSTNPFTIMIAVAFATPVLSFICALFSFTVAFYLLRMAIKHETEKLAKVAYCEFFVFNIAVLVLHIATMYNGFFVE